MPHCRHLLIDPARAVPAPCVGLSLFISLWLLMPSACAGPAAAPRKTVLAVQACQAEQRLWPQAVAAGGAIAAWQESSASAVVGGLRILETYAAVGDAVRRGQLLVRLDSGALLIEAAALRAERAQAQAQHAQADANRLRMQGVADSGSISAQELLDYVTKAGVALAQLDAAGSRLAAVEWQIAHADVRAPDDGVVSVRSAAVGSVAATGQEFYRIIRQRRLEWRGELTAQQVAGIHPGQAVTLVLPGGATAHARVRQLAPAMQAQTRLATVYADLAAGGVARAGMYADGTIELAARAMLTVPASSVFVRDGRSVVARIDGGDAATATVRLQTVSVGQRLGGRVEIVSGLEPRSRIVVRGGSFLGDGDGVQIVSGSTP